MPEEVVKFDPSAYVEAIRNKVKDAMVSLIPDEQWNTMIKAQIEAFMADRRERDWNGQIKTSPSEISQVVGKILKDEVHKQVSILLAQPEWQGHWEGMRRLVGVEVARVASENGASIINAWLAQAVQDFVNKLGPR